MKREKERELGLGIIDWRIAARSAIHLYRRTGVTPDEANRAACLIQVTLMYKYVVTWNLIGGNKCRPHIKDITRGN